MQQKSFKIFAKIGLHHGVQQIAYDHITRGFALLLYKIICQVQVKITAIIRTKQVIDLSFLHQVKQPVAVLLQKTILLQQAFSTIIICLCHTIIVASQFGIIRSTGK